MGNISHRKFMASRIYISMWAICGFLFMLNGVMHFLTKNWFLVPFDMMITIAYAFVVFRLLNYPVIQFYDDHIEFIHILIFPNKNIPINDILDIEKNGAAKYKIVLRNNKSIRLPIKMIQKSDRDLVISELNKMVTDPSAKKSESIIIANTAKEGSWL
jgi:hypothetical protein